MKSKKIKDLEGNIRYLAKEIKILNREKLGLKRQVYRWEKIYGEMAKKPNKI